MRTVQRTSRGGVGAWALGLAATLLLLPSAARPQEGGVLGTGRKLTLLFYAGSLEQFWARMSDGLRAELGSVENLSKFRSAVRALVGEEARVVNEEVVRADGQEVYVRRVMYAKTLEPFELRMAFSGSGQVADFNIRPALPAAAFRYRTKARLRLPFEGDWVVGSGGRTREQNANHHDDYMSRFDSDFVRAEDARFDKEANPPRNEDFAAFGAPVLAPAPGRVALVRDGVADNAPGQPNLRPEERAGNFVVIAHGRGEYSLLAHLKRGSVSVRAGQRVRAGQKVGECGNSGNSSGPHLHYGLRAAANPDEGMSLPAQFRSYLAGGKLVRRGEVLRGQRVSPAPGR